MDGWGRASTDPGSPDRGDAALGDESSGGGIPIASARVCQGMQWLARMDKMPASKGGVQDLQA